AALTGEKVHLPDSVYTESGAAIESRVSVEITDTDLCPRYCATLISGVTVAESPRWLRQRLVSYGMRPINNIVDITNFVMLEYGQPLHAFDFERIRGGRIIVRRARDGEHIVSLDDVERDLASNMLVIADEDRAVAVAGVMGGANSEVTDGTTTILLEAASFDPRSVHYTARTLQMPSEASIRFERGIAPGLTLPAIERATQLIADLGGGEAASGEVAAGIIDVYPGRVEPAPVTITPEETARVLGVTFSRERIVDTLTALGFACRQGATAAEVAALAPDWRSDIAQPVDLIEEVARVIGYDEIPVTILGGSVPRHNPEPVVVLRRRLGEWLTGLGFQEIVSHSLTGLDSVARLYPESEVDSASLLRLSNAMTVTQEYLRPDLRSCLLSSLANNQGRAAGGIRLYEIGKVYRPGEEGCLPDEFDMLAAVVSGARDEAWWQGTGDAPGGGGELGFFDAKGAVESLLDRLGVSAVFEPGRDPSLHPASQAVILAPATQAGVRAGESYLGVIGEVHPNVLDRFDIDGPACFFEISLPALLSTATGHHAYLPVSRFPAIIRDVALVVDAAVPQRRIADIIGGFPLVVQVTLFDVYSGEQVPAGKKSLAYRVGYQSPDHTLTDGEVDKVQKKVLSRLFGEVGAVLRG
ncbi:MAG: phenylalanine--tRNA ligase subunit beta, partial [Dehalococcoidales bacterium]